ncbi:MULTISPECIES: transposase family protein [unclassified Streptomyces]|uniref:transposase family protein n=1 Tax=unclassified Streptomyces TaxID=2593676 RepID=UPI000ADF957B|nr:transposase family protein [Streptomyces sp. TSRI0281]
MTNAKALPVDTCSLVYQCRLPLSTRAVNHLADLLRRHLKAIPSRWRILPPGKIAVTVLAVLRHDQRLADMADGNDVSESSVRRWHDELIRLLAAQAPRLDRALKKVAKQGGELVLTDGTLIRTRRRTGKADRRNYSGKHRSHGPHFLALTDETGRVIWIFAARPGRTHDNTAARHDHILAHLRAAGLGALADLGFRGLDNNIRDPLILTGYAATRTHKLTPGQKEANRVLAVGRAPVEHGFAHLKNWRILTKLRADPARHPTPARVARPDEPRSQPLTNDLLRGLTPTTSTSTRRTDHTSPLTWHFKLAATHPPDAHHRGLHSE